MLRRFLLAPILATALATPRGSHAQRTLGPGDDGSTLPGGMLRVRASTFWQRAWERSAPADGVREPLGADFTADSVGIRQVGALAPTESAIRLLADMPGYRLSLGAWRTSRRTTTLTTPVGIDLGVTDRVTLSAYVPFVEARSQVAFVSNPGRTEGTVGLNPALQFSATRTANAALATGFGTAATSLSGALDRCTATPGGTGCAPLLANAAAARALVNDTRAVVSAMLAVYGAAAAGTGAPVVPVAGSASQRAIEARLATLRAAFLGFGVADAPSGAPAGAAGVLTAAQVQSLLADSTLGLRTRPLATSVDRGIGDAEVGATLNLIDTFGRGLRRLSSRPGWRVRQSVGVVARLASGAAPPPDGLTDLGTGDGQPDLELRSFTDIGRGPVWATVAVRWNQQRPDTRTLRIVDTPRLPLVPAARARTVRRDLGDELEASIAPRVQVGDYLSVGAEYRYRVRWLDRYRVVGDADPVAVGNGIGTGAREQRAGIGFTYSTVAPWVRRTANWPFEITYWHTQPLRGAGGVFAMPWSDLVQLRAYARLWGR